MAGLVFTSLSSILLTSLMFMQQASVSARPEAAPAVDELISSGFPFPRTIMRSELEQTFGKPVSVSEKQVEDKRLSTLRFAGLVIEVYDKAAGARGTVSSIELKDNRWHFPARLRIGSTRAEMLKLLGRPDIERPSEAVYGCYECVYDDKIHVSFDGDKIKSLKWDFYLN